MWSVTELTEQRSSDLKLIQEQRVKNCFFFQEKKKKKKKNNNNNNNKIMVSRLATGRRVSSSDRAVDTGGRGRPVPTRRGQNPDPCDQCRMIKSWFSLIVLL